MACLNIVRSKADFLKARNNQFIDPDRRIDETTEALSNFFRKQLRSNSDSYLHLVNSLEELALTPILLKDPEERLRNYGTVTYNRVT